MRLVSLALRVPEFLGTRSGLATLACAALALALWLLPHAAADIYDALIVRMTSKWYAAVLRRLEPGSRVLDVGIGTAGALVHRGNARTVRERRLAVVGIDYEACYVEKAKRAVAAAGLADLVSVRCESVYDVPALRAELAGASRFDVRFDAVYFSGSLALVPDAPAALKCAAAVLRPGGLVYVTQTFQRRRVPLLAWLKPLLRHVTSVDFGRLTYHSEVAEIVERAGMELVEDAPVAGSIDNGWQSARLLVLRARKAE